ncbi:MAG: deoxyhypusine synthase family protein, partial [Candidatus Aenigmarchaeota archaeon]|nr:deoxyhypusine synthase family protein [Candidatus Aenigmarchaeota archaeon]
MKSHFQNFGTKVPGKSVRHFKPRKLTVNEAIEQFSGMGFGARKLAMATDVWERMIRDKECFKMMSVYGAMVPGGMKDCLIEIVRSGWVDVLVTT